MRPLMHATVRLAAASLFALAMLGVVDAQDPERVLFVSNYSDPPSFGYDFAEGVEEGIASNGWNVYRMTVTNANFDYLANNLDEFSQSSGKQSYAVAFRIKAEQVDGRDSGFAAVFSTEPDFGKGTGAGAGKVDGSFRNSVKVKFQESGNAWSLKLTEVVEGVESTLATGSTHGSDQHRLFHFLVDNRAESGPRIELQDYAGAPILSAESNQAFHGQSFKSQWFVGYGFGANQRDTYLVADSPSTRLYDTAPEPPIVEAVEFDPNPPEHGEVLTVIASITDDWSVERAIVFYRVESSPAQQVEMHHDVGSRWIATVPGQGANTTVTVRVEAYDDQDLVGHSDGEYSYRVGSGSAISKDPNSEKPVPPGGGGVEGRASLSWHTIGLVLLIVLIGWIGTALVMREWGKTKGWYVVASTVLAVTIFLLFEFFPAVQARWFTALGAFSAASIAVGVWYKVRGKQEPREGA